MSRDGINTESRWCQVLNKNVQIVVVVKKKKEEVRNLSPMLEVGSRGVRGETHNLLISCFLCWQIVNAERSNANVKNDVMREYFFT